MITLYFYCLLHRGTGSLTNKTDIETAAAINVDSEAMSDNLQNVINHRHYVLNRLISGNVRHQIQECTCTLIQKQTNKQTTDLIILGQSRSTPPLTDHFTLVRKI